MHVGCFNHVYFLLCVYVRFIGITDGSHVSQLHQSNIPTFGGMVFNPATYSNSCNTPLRTTTPEVTTGIEYWIEQNRRLTLELAHMRDWFYHPETKTSVPEDQTQLIGPGQRIRLGWEGPVFQINIADDLSRMVDYLKAQGVAEAGPVARTRQVLSAARDELAEAYAEIARLKAELAIKNSAPDRSRRVIER